MRAATYDPLLRQHTLAVPPLSSELCSAYSCDVLFQTYLPMSFRIAPKIACEFTARVMPQGEMLQQVHDEPAAASFSEATARPAREANAQGAMLPVWASPCA